MIGLLKSRFLWRLLPALWLLAAADARGQFISGFSQNFGGPGAQITIFGSGFLGTTQVRFNQSIADFQVINSGQILATVPTNGVTGPISVTVSFTATSAQTFYVAPRVTRFFSTTSGNIVAAVGQQLQIEGANFLSGNTTVTFGSVTVAASSVIVTAEGESSLLFVTVPAGATTGPLRMDNYGGTFITSTNLVVGNGLVITSFEPTSGTTNEVVILEGGNFTGVTNVTFNGTNASFAVTAPNQIHAVVPPGATTGPIGVWKAGLSSTSSVPFTVTGIAPVITGFHPPGAAVGQPVTIDGRYFTGATNVTFNGTNVLAFTVTADSQINTTVPPGVTAGPIRVFSPYGVGVSSNSFLLGPLITSFDPVSGTVDSRVNIFGENFAGVTNVLIGGTSAVFSAVAQNQLAATVPPGASNGPITVISPAGTNTTSSNFTVIAAAPVITGFAPAGGLANDEVQIFGANFTGVTNVSFNGANDLTFGVTADTLIIAHVPAAATTGPISVSGPGGTATTTNDFYLPPRLKGLTPASGIVGSTVTITGTNFAGVAAVEFTASNSLFLGANFSVTATQIMATVPTNALTGPLRVTAPGGVVITTNSFSVLPKINSVSPLFGPAGTLLTISGSGFNTVTDVRFNGFGAVFTNLSTTETVAVVPSGAPSGPISLTTTAGSDTSAESFIRTVAADVSLRLTNSMSPALVNRLLTYTLVVSNAGPSLATTVRVTNNLPTNVVFVSFTNTAGLAVRTNNLIIWTFPVLTNGTGATLTVTVMPTNSGTLINSATATAAETEVNAADNSVFVSTPAIFAAPIITGFSPASGPAGTPVQITGSNLTGTATVSFNGVPTTSFLVASDTEITDAIVPAAATTGPVSVNGPGGTATTTDLFYLPPRLFSLTPTNGIVGSTVILTGANFTGVSAVEFTASGGFLPGVILNSTATRIEAVAPTNALTGPLRVTTPGGIVVSTNAFTVLPKIYSFTPLAGPVGTRVTISGSGFNTVAGVNFNGVDAAFTKISSTTVEATVPGGATNGPISLSTTDGADTSADSFVVGAAVDLTLRLTAMPATGLVEQPLTYTLTVSNTGSLTATSVEIDSLVPANALFVSFTNTGGLAAKTNDTIYWSFPALTNGVGATLTVVVTPTNTDILVFQANASAVELEANPADNTILLSTPVTDTTRVLSIRRVGGDASLEIAWPVSSTTLKLQQTTNLPSTGAATWLDVGSAGRLTNSIGVFNVHTTNTVAPPRYYRLTSP